MTSVKRASSNRGVAQVRDLTHLERAAVLSGATVWETRSVPRVGLRALNLSDGPHGIRKQVGSSDHLGINASQPATCFPTAATVANSWDVELAEQIGAALGAEAAARGVDVVLGPGLNIKRSPLCGRNFEYFSEDPYFSGKLAAAYVRGIQSQGVAASPKHFAANSQELRRMASDSVIDERTLREIYLTAFEIVVREGDPWAIMSSYNRVNGTYAHENSHLLKDILRDEWNFDGAVISDWGGSNDAVSAVAAGGTLEMPAPGLDSARQILAAVAEGRLAQADVDERAAEILALVNRIEPELAQTDDAREHHRLARRAAEASQVLLKNDGDILPLARGTRVAIVGDFAANPRYQGAGSSLVNPTNLRNTLDAVESSGLLLVRHAQGFQRSGEADERLVADAIEAAQVADVVLLYLGLDETSETEGNDRVHLRLPQNQLDLLERLAEVSERIVVVLSAGSVVEMPWLPQAAALVHGYLGGQAGAEATMNVLTGAVNPSGRLAESYPLRLEDNPSNFYYPGHGSVAEYREGLYVGYRYYTTVQQRVLFPFGFGLSYTTFEYGDLAVGAAAATVEVRNTGASSGSEVVQLYVGRTSDGVHRADRELKGFAKVKLAPGETATVTIPIDEYAFRHFDVAEGRWKVEAGDYWIGIGANADDIRTSVPVRIDGEAAEPVGRWDLISYYSGYIANVPDVEFEALLGRPIPADESDSLPLDSNSPLRAMHHARSPLARFAARTLKSLILRSERRGKPDLNLYFQYNMPFRAIAKMTNGVASIEMVEGLVTLVNGRHLRGLKKLVRGYSRNRRVNRTLSAELAQSSTATAPSASA